MSTRAKQIRPTQQAKRYRAGQVPENYVDDLSDSEEEELQQQQQQHDLQSQETKKTAALQFAQKDVVTGLKQIEISEKEAASDRRLQRLRQAQLHNDQDAGPRRRRIVEQEDDTQGDAATEEEQARERLRLKQQLLRQQEEALAKQEEEGSEEGGEEEEEEEEEESSSEYETDSEEEDEIQRMPKPLFIPKAHRETVIQQEQLQREEEERERKLAEELEARRQQSHQMLAEELKREKEGDPDKDLSTYDIPVDDTDGLDEEGEFEAWKVRELQRIKRDREERINREREQEEIERRRELPEELRLKEDLKRAEETRQRERGQYTFMQKFYHKGAFYQDEEDEILKRDYTAPTIDEVRKKELLPKVMQVKNFGLAGRTKWTHLAAEDTSTRDSPWANPLPNKRRRREY